MTPLLLRWPFRGPARAWLSMGTIGLMQMTRSAPLLDGQVDVRRLLDPAVHVVAAADAHRPVEAGQGRGGLHGLRDGDVAVAPLPEGHRLAAVEVHRDDVQVSGQVVERVAASAARRTRRPGTPARRSCPAGRRGGARTATSAKSARVRPSPVREVTRRPSASTRGAAPSGARTRPGPGGTAARRDRRPAPRAAGHRVVHLARGRSPPARSDGDERPAADPDVQVEVEDAAVEEVLQRAQAPDLVDRAGDAAPRADQRYPGGPSGDGAAPSGHLGKEEPRVEDAPGALGAPGLGSATASPGRGAPRTRPGLAARHRPRRLPGGLAGLGPRLAEAVDLPR